jgi:AcrR family transcriptional regulator
VPRMGLTPDKVVAAAARLADDVGLNDLSLAALAAKLGVRVPSLYKHVGGLDDLQHRMAGQGSAGIAAAIDAAARGKRGRDALGAIGTAYRRYALDNRGRYEAMARVALEESETWQPFAPVETALRRAALEHGLGPAEAHDVARAMLGALHGFTLLEFGGLFRDAPVPGRPVVAPVAAPVAAPTDGQSPMETSESGDACHAVLIAMLERGLSSSPSLRSRFGLSTIAARGR